MTAAAGFDQTQARISRGGVVTRNTTAGASSLRNAPTDGSGVVRGTVPDYVLSPVTAPGLPTRGFLLVINQPTTFALAPAIPIAAGFTVVVWVRNPLTYRWSPLPSFVAAVGELWSNTDLDPCELYFQVAAASIASDGPLSFAITEVG